MLEEANKLIAESCDQIKTLETENAKLKEEAGALEEKMKEKEERAKKVLTNARTKINKVEAEKKQLETKLQEVSNQEGKLGAFVAQIKSLKTAKQQEKENLLKEVEKLQQELVAVQLTVAYRSLYCRSVQPTLKSPSETSASASSSETIQVGRFC